MTLPKRVANAAGISGEELGKAAIAQKRQSSFRLHKIDALPAMLPRREIVEGLLAPGEIAAVIGAPGKGKSAVLQHLMTRTAEGGLFFGRKVRAGPAVYVAAERFQDTSRRLLAIRGGPSPLYITKDRPDLSNADDVQALASAINAISEAEGESPVLIAFDTFARCIPGCDENSARDMGQIIENLTRLGEQVRTAAIIFVHHTSKGGENMRGSSALLGGIDLELAVEPAADGLRRLSVTKANAVDEGQSFLFRLVPIEGAPNETVISIVEVESEERGDLPPTTGPSRAERVLHVIQELSLQGRADRRACREQVQAKGIIVGKTPESTSEQFRKVLKELCDGRQITFDNKTIWLGHPG